MEEEKQEGIYDNDIESSRKEKNHTSDIQLAESLRRYERNLHQYDKSMRKKKTARYSNQD